MYSQIDTGDTISAIATAPGPGAIGIVRTTGPKALAAAGAVFACHNHEPITHRRVALGNLIDPRDGVAFDEAPAYLLQGAKFLHSARSR